MPCRLACPGDAICADVLLERPCGLKAICNRFKPIYIDRIVDGIKTGYQNRYLKETPTRRFDE